MKYKEVLILEMNRLAQNPKVFFIGYNTAYGPRMNGTLFNIPVERCIEVPVAENLMCGIAMGLALEGFFPVLCFERMDFTLAAADALVNHIGALQHYGMTLPMIIRVCVGNDKPLDPGEQHKQNYRNLFYGHLEVGESSLAPGTIEYWYGYAKKLGKPIMLIERKDMYDTDINS